jgi:hypothetical protein
LNRRTLIGIAAFVAALGGGYLGWLNWQASRTAATVPPPASAEQHFIKIPPVFEDVTADSGVDFLHWCGDGGKYFFPEVMGSGIALLDYDCDGRLDLFVVQGMPAKRSGSPETAPPSKASPTSRLYRQEEGGRFRDVTDEAGLDDDQPYGMGVAVGDVNNDGWTDIYVTKFGHDRLFLNNQGKFEEITAAAGISNPRWGTSAGFVDFDRDGWLDLLVTNYVDYFPSQDCVEPNGAQDYCGPQVFADAPSKLFRNLTGLNRAGDATVRFRDVSLESGIDAKPGPGLGVLFEDFTGDGWPDLYVANDAKANFLWVNQQDGTFVDEAIAAGAAYDRAGRAQSSMGVVAGDLIGNGRRDLFMTHLDGEYSTLYREVAPGIFEDRTVDAGLGSTTPFTGFGTGLADVDLDGDLDLLVANGRVRRHDKDRAAPSNRAAFWATYAERNQLFVNDGQGTFAEVDPTGEPFCSGAHVARGLALGDLDNDGDLDVVTSEVNGPARIYRNNAPRQGNWLVVRATEPAHGGRDAYGAIVTVRLAKRSLTRTISPAFSYLSSSDPRAHFGLGAESRFDEVLVQFADGEVEAYPGGEANRSLTLERGTGAKP